MNKYYLIKIKSLNHFLLSKFRILIKRKKRLLIVIINIIIFIKF